MTEISGSEKKPNSPFGAIRKTTTALNDAIKARQESEISKTPPPEQMIKILNAELDLAKSTTDELRNRSVEAGEKLAHAEAQSTIDEKTNLYNEKGFRLALNRTLAEITRTGEPLTLLFFDLDGFKGVNDKLGHAVGDKILTEVAALLKRYLRETDLIARIGGDEFVAALKSNLPEVLARLEQVRETDMPKQINNALVQMGESPDGIRVSTSLGAAQYGPEAKGYDELKIIADTRMYEDKNSRKDRYKREAL